MTKDKYKSSMQATTKNNRMLQHLNKQLKIQNLRTDPKASKSLNWQIFKSISFLYTYTL